MTGVPNEPPPAVLNISRYCIGGPAQYYADKTALVVVPDLDDTSTDERWSYRELDETVCRFATGLVRTGLRPGDRLLVRMKNTSEFALMFFGAMAAGIIPIPTSEQLSAREVDYMLSDSGAAGMAVTPGLEMPEFLPDIKIIGPEEAKGFYDLSMTAYARTKADDPAFLIYTSGTSGNPKGVLHAHRSIWGRRPMYQGWYGISSEDIMVHAGAFNWTYTLGVGISDPLANGATTVLFTGEKHASAWPRLINREHGTIFAAVPTVYRQILKYSEEDRIDLPTLRHGLTAGEPLPLDVSEEWRRRTDRVLYEALGMSEISTYISSSPTVPVVPGSPGRPQTGRRVGILAADDDSVEPAPPGTVGLLAVHNSDPGLMLRYWNRPEDTAAAYRGDWFIGGDLAMIDKNGYVWFDGRADDVMNAMGYRVSPAEVEEVMTAHKSVSECAVTEIEVRKNISVIAAFVVTVPGIPVDAETLLDHASRELARYKCPREIVFLDALPRTPNGKLVRKKLKPLFQPGI